MAGVNAGATHLLRSFMIASSLGGNVRQLNRELPVSTDYAVLHAPRRAAARRGAAAHPPGLGRAGAPLSRAGPRAPRRFLGPLGGRPVSGRRFPRALSPRARTPRRAAALPRCRDGGGALVQGGDRVSGSGSRSTGSAGGGAPRTEFSAMSDGCSRAGRVARRDRAGRARIHRDDLPEGRRAAGGSGGGRRTVA